MNTAKEIVEAGAKRAESWLRPGLSAEYCARYIIRDALKAASEPTEAMCKAAVEVSHGLDIYMYQAMIRALLRELEGLTP